MTHLDFSHSSDAMIPFPATKVGWEPRASGPATKLITTGDYLRLWDYSPDGKLQQKSALLNKSKSEIMPPLTSFDWNKADPSLVITSSIDTTCTIWDINTSSAKTQLIAHDSEVYDVSFVAGSVEIFASVGADGSVRVFDLRSLDHSTIIYEPSNPLPLVRLATSPYDRHIMATIAHDSDKIHILDIRSPGIPVTVLQGHFSTVNAIAWAPPNARKLSHQSSRHLIASAGDDYNANIWDLSSPDTASTPVCVYTDSSEINNIAWSPNGDWLGVVSGRGFQGVRL